MVDWDKVDRAGESCDFELEMDFPIPAREKELGSAEYRHMHGKFKGKQNIDIDLRDLADYLNHLDKVKDQKPWQKEMQENIEKYLMRLWELSFG